MMKQLVRFLALGLACLAALSAGELVQAQAISFLGVTKDVTDFSDTGLDLGNEGYWFANFDAASDSGQDPVFEDAVDQLPSWLSNLMITDDMTGTGETAYSRGGVTSWSTLTLPDGTSGLSGSIVDPNADDNSNNTIPSILMGADTPPSFLMHVVVDNTNNEHDSGNRIRARAESPDLDFRVNTDPSDFNGIPDVYTFRYDGYGDGDIIKMQLNSGVAGVDPGFAGLMFDRIPEPSSCLLLALAGIGLAAYRRR